LVLKKYPIWGIKSLTRIEKKVYFIDLLDIFLNTPRRQEKEKYLKGKCVLGRRVKKRD
jgi:hypothetical protein